MVRKRESSSLLSGLRSAALYAAAAIAIGTGCAGSAAPKPDLPASVSPGWKLDGFDTTVKPADVPGDPVCWKARYSADMDGGKSNADAILCGYKVEGGAFDAAQRARAEARTVKFQQGRYLILVSWSGAKMSSVTALVRAIQKDLSGK